MKFEKYFLEIKVKNVTDQPGCLTEVGARDAYISEKKNSIYYHLCNVHGFENDLKISQIQDGVLTVSIYAYIC